LRYIGSYLVGKIIAEMLEFQNTNYEGHPETRGDFFYSNPADNK